nr:MAG TPA: protein of unknown function (UPF0183) [Caudoviricetes sp.]
MDRTSFLMGFYFFNFFNLGVDICITICYTIYIS